MAVIIASLVKVFFAFIVTIIVLVYGSYIPFSITLITSIIFITGTHNVRETYGVSILDNEKKIIGLDSETRIAKQSSKGGSCCISYVCASAS